MAPANGAQLPSRRRAAQRRGARRPRHRGRSEMETRDGSSATGHLQRRRIPGHPPLGRQLAQLLHHRRETVNLDAQLVVGGQPAFELGRGAALSNSPSRYATSLFAQRLSHHSSSSRVTKALERSHHQHLHRAQRDPRARRRSRLAQVIVKAHPQKPPLLAGQAGKHGRDPIALDEQPNLVDRGLGFASNAGSPGPPTGSGTRRRSWSIARLRAIVITQVKQPPARGVVGRTALPDLEEDLLLDVLGRRPITERPQQEAEGDAPETLIGVGECVGVAICEPGGEFRFGIVSGAGFADGLRHRTTDDRGRR